MHGVPSVLSVVSSVRCVWYSLRSCKFPAGPWEPGPASTTRQPQALGVGKTGFVHRLQGGPRAAGQGWGAPGPHSAPPPPPA